MTYKQGKCSANCGFCPQARKSKGRADMLSRVTWPAFPAEQLLDRLAEKAKEGKIRRVCIQALNYPKVFAHLLALVETIQQRASLAISISCQPLKTENMQSLAKAGVDRVGIPLDAATKGLFDKVKGASVGGQYRWESQIRLLSEAVSIFGKGKVSTHLIVGLGETEKELVEIIQKCADMGVFPALFAFTPISGTALVRVEQPEIQKYRRMQVARYLVVSGIARYDEMSFDAKGRLTSLGVEERILTEALQSGKPFLTSGCPNCNRPYYNEKPSGPLYNYPRDLTQEELTEARRQARCSKV